MPTIWPGFSLIVQDARGDDARGDGSFCHLHKVKVCLNSQTENDRKNRPLLHQLMLGIFLLGDCKSEVEPQSGKD